MDEFMYGDFFEFEKTHWWFAARRYILMNLIKDYLPPSPANRILDIGCGAGLTLQSLSSFGRVFGIDASELAIHYSRKNSDGPLVLGSLDQALPFKSRTFHLITMLDILEHIEDDVGAMVSVGSLLEKGGLLVCTVPAFRCLWSRHDEVNRHLRRYYKAELVGKLTAAGFAIRKITYFNFFLFGPIWVRRQLNRCLPTKARRSDFTHLGRLSNTCLRTLFQWEYQWLKTHVFPFGVSLLAIAGRD